MSENRMTPPAEGGNGDIISNRVVKSRNEADWLIGINAIQALNIATIQRVKNTKI